MERKFTITMKKKDIETIIDEAWKEREEIINKIWNQRSKEVVEWEKILGITKKDKKNKRNKAKKRRNSEKNRGERKMNIERTSKEKQEREEKGNMIKNRWVKKYIRENIERDMIYKL
jgi:hypothetical protein